MYLHWASGLLYFKSIKVWGLQTNHRCKVLQTNRPCHARARQKKCCKVRRSDGFSKAERFEDWAIEFYAGYPRTNPAFPYQEQLSWCGQNAWVLWGCMYPKECFSAGSKNRHASPWRPRIELRLEVLKRQCWLSGHGPRRRGCGVDCLVFARRTRRVFIKRLFKECCLVGFMYIRPTKDDPNLGVYNIFIYKVLVFDEDRR